MRTLHLEALEPRFLLSGCPNPVNSHTSQPPPAQETGQTPPAAGDNNASSNQATPPPATNQGAPAGQNAPAQSPPPVQSAPAQGAPDRQGGDTRQAASLGQGPGALPGPADFTPAAAPAQAFLAPHPGGSGPAANLADGNHAVNAAFGPAGVTLQVPAVQTVTMQPLLAGAAPAGDALTAALTRCRSTPAGGEEDPSATPEALALAEPKATALRPASVGAEQPDLAVAQLPAAQTAGLLSVLPIDPAVVDRAIQGFVEELERVGQAVVTPKNDSGVGLWIIVGATGAAAAACELARRQYKRPCGPDEEGRRPWLSPWSAE
jgi:hypothetical protein